MLLFYVSDKPKKRPMDTTDRNPFSVLTENSLGEGVLDGAPDYGWTHSSSAEFWPNNFLFSNPEAASTASTFATGNLALFLSMLFLYRFKTNLESYLFIF